MWSIASAGSTAVCLLAHHGADLELVVELRGVARPPDLDIRPDDRVDIALVVDGELEPLLRRRLFAGVPDVLLDEQEITEAGRSRERSQQPVCSRGVSQARPTAYRLRLHDPLERVPCGRETRPAQLQQLKEIGWQRSVGRIPGPRPHRVRSTHPRAERGRCPKGPRT
jgi:hypothetical protein